MENEATFTPPLEASLIRVLLKEPDAVPKVYGFTAEIHA